MKQKRQHKSIPLVPCQLIKIGERHIEICQLENEYFISQTQVEQAIDKTDSTVRYYLERQQLWHSTLPDSLTIKKYKPNQQPDQSRTVKPIPLEMAYLYWQIIAQKRSQAKAIIECLGQDGFEQLKKLADIAFNSLSIYPITPITSHQNPTNKSNHIHIRLTDFDYTQIKNLAQQVNLNMSDFMRRAALKRTMPNPIPALDLQSYQVLCEINGKLQQAGNNLDRIAKACNTSMLLGESVAANHQLLESTRQILKENQTLVQTIVAAVINLPAA
ncbi:MAG: hypothetical protein MUE44_28755 [Oscillatoriaceae cyanobacterium Prado104]|jgi:hypothetical protein|nr:hypothetical protein [Oscillatoriaceae cyanobacterium Prado104]